MHPTSLINVKPFSHLVEVKKCLHSYNCTKNTIFESCSTFRNFRSKKRWLIALWKKFQLPTTLSSCFLKATKEFDFSNISFSSAPSNFGFHQNFQSQHLIRKTWRKNSTQRIGVPRLHAKKHTKVQLASFVTRSDMTRRFIRLYFVFPASIASLYRVLEPLGTEASIVKPLANIFPHTYYSLVRILYMNPYVCVCVSMR